jgi:glycosyltransferase involved in cell wall biosynthesis
MKPVVSVVIPSYNYASFLGRALKSLIEQTYSNWEAIIIDNYSKDNTDEIVNAFMDPRIRILKIRNNGVIAASRNLGIRESKGDWVAFLDADDFWYPKKLEVCMKMIGDDAIDVVGHDEMMVNIQTGFKRVLRHGPFQRDFYKTLLVEGNRLSPSATMVNKLFIEKNKLFFSESKAHITVEDYDYWMRIADCDAKFKFIRNILGEYTIHGDNSVANLNLHLLNCKNLLHEHVYTMQNFAKEKDRLWKYIEVRLSLSRGLSCSSDAKLVAVFMAVLRILKKHPKLMLVYLLRRTAKSVKIALSQYHK